MAGGGRRRVVHVAAVAALGGFLFGYDTGVVNGAVTAVQTEFGISDLYLGLVVSATLVGGAVGAAFAGPLADRISRVHVMLITAVIFMVAALGSGLSTSAPVLMAARFVGGLALGAATVIGPTYIAEIAPKEIRGRLGSLQQLALVFGIFTALLVDLVLATVAGDPGAREPWGDPAWRWMFFSGVVPAVSYGLLALRIPPSPRYLVKTGQTERAREVLSRYVEGDVEGEVSRIQRSLAGVGKVRLADLRGPRLGLQAVVWVGLLLAVFQQFVGINVIFYYSTSLWRAVGFPEERALITSVITGIVNIAATFIAIAVIDRLGRRRLLIAGAGGMVVTLATLALCFSTGTGHGEHVTLTPRVGLLALVAANLFVLSFGATWGPVTWVLLGEMFNNRIRATALAVAAAAQWVANWIISLSFPSLADRGLGLAYGIYATFAVLALLFVAKAAPETKGRSLEEM